VLPEAPAEQTLTIGQGVVTPEGPGSAGFDPALEVPTGASAKERLVTFLGRQP
jgi:hypothetical protein